MSIEIEKNVPIPDGSRIVGKSVAILDKMEVGDSIVIDSIDNTRSSYHSAARYRNMKVAVRKINETQMRIWRIA